MVRAVRTALEPPVSALDVPESPRLVRLENIQHLETPIAAALRGAANLIDLLLACTRRPRSLARRATPPSTGSSRTRPSIAAGTPAGSGGRHRRRRRAAARRCARALVAAPTRGSTPAPASSPTRTREAELAETRLKLRALLAPLLEL